jgi:hypothetical protein
MAKSFDALTYNVAIDLARSSSDPATLIDAQSDALIRAGASPDSVARLIALAPPLGLPLSGSDVPANHLHQGITWLGRLDDTRDTLGTRALTTYVGYTTDGALGFGPTSAPSASGERRERTLGATHAGQLRRPERRILTETRFRAEGVRTQVTHTARSRRHRARRSSSLDPERDVAATSRSAADFSLDRRFAMDRRGGQ